MRFGKKLAMIALRDQQEGRMECPYISHKRLKQLLSDAAKVYKERGSASEVQSTLIIFDDILRTDFLHINEFVDSQIRSITLLMDEVSKESRKLGISDRMSLAVLIKVYKEVTSSARNV